jgi:nitrate/TMAO reductase-like tetraheme cytochrome c subunit
VSRALARSACAIALLLAAAAAHADGVPVPRNAPPAYAQECGACHTAYPPGLLPASSWTRIMGSLDKHFGTNAALDDKSALELARYLQSNAGTYKRAAATPDARISSAEWFQRKHRKVGQDTWKLRTVGGPANCTACHKGAAEGDFSERNLAVPR